MSISTSFFFLERLIENSICPPGGCSVLRPRAPPFCVKSPGAAEAGGRRPAIPGILGFPDTRGSGPLCSKSLVLVPCSGLCFFHQAQNPSHLAPRHRKRTPSPSPSLPLASVSRDSPHFPPCAENKSPLVLVPCFRR